MTIIKSLLRYYLLLITIFFFGRVFLFIAYYERFFDSNETIWLSFLYGLRIDTITASVFLLLPMFVLTLTTSKIEPLRKIFLKYYFLFILSTILFIEVATFPFMQQFDARPNYLFLEYLVYPQEIVNMITKSYLSIIIIFAILLSLFISLYLKFFNKIYINTVSISFPKRILLIIPLILILFLGIRSSFGHRPANISDAMFSSNRILNEITKNSIHSIGYALYSNIKHNNGDLMKQYGTVQINEALRTVQSYLNIDQQNTLNRFKKSHFKKQKNLVIIIEESMGYQFIESLGGTKGLTSTINQLSQEGIFFTNLYSNGTRSVRGLAGLSSGILAVPGESVVKRNKSQKNFFTIAKILKPLNYDLSFIYGGESRFDNMRSWYLGNGFDTIIDQTNFKNPSFVGTWGVCDEDLMQKANDYYKQMHTKDHKFASIIFSSSNHIPFDFPENKISPVPNTPLKSVENAVKYADYALGKFFKQAKQEDYYKDTVFVIVADHNVRVYGDDVVPVDMFQIPGLIIGNDIEPMQYSQLASQPDVLATALDLSGISTTYPIMGNSIFDENKKSFALMQFDQTYALKVNNKVAIIQPNKKASTYLYENKHLKPVISDLQLQNDALAFVLTLDYLYQKKLYQ